MVKNAITLSFQTIECDGCKAWRPRATTCPDCGALPYPFEVQVDVAHRARIVDECLRAERTTAKASNDWEESLSAVPRILDRINRALQRAASLKGGSEQVLHAFAELDSQINAWSDRQPRPHTNRARVLQRSLVSLRAGYETFLRALAAPEPGEAQRLELSGQKLLDDAAATIGELKAVGDAQTALELPLNDYFAHIARETRIADGLPSEVTELDELMEVSDPETADIISQSIRHMMISMLDLEQGLAVAQATTSLLGDSPDLYENDIWLREHSRSTSLLSVSAYALTSLEDDSTEFETAKLLLEVVKDSREGFIRHALATILAVDVKEYVKLVRSSTGSVINRAATAHPQLMLNENLSPYLRHAIAHADFDWEDQHFVTHPKGVELRVDEATFLDGCLAYLETAAALLLGIHHHAQKNGRLIDADSHLSKRDREAALTMALTYIGFADVRVHLEGSTVTIHAAGDHNKFVMLAAVVSSIASDTHTSLEARLTDRDGILHRCSNDLRSVRKFDLNSASGDLDIVIRAAELMSTTRIDGNSPWVESEWLNSAFAVSTRKDQESLVEPIRRVKHIKRLAVNAGIQLNDDRWEHLLTYLRTPLPEAAVPEIPAAFRRT